MPERSVPARTEPLPAGPDLPVLTLPIVHARSGRDVGHFHVEELDLEFSNGERRHYERLHSHGHGAVMIAALPDADTILLVREYACGMHRYELGLPKGRMDAGETPLQAADRELKEEAGFGARDLRVLRMLTLAPTYMSHEIHLVLARDLYPQRLPGDEPEQLEVIPWRLDALHDLALREDCSEGRSLAAIFLVRELLRHGLPA
jgi:ADP-ribose diphosphatase